MYRQPFDYLVTGLSSSRLVLFWERSYVAFPDCNSVLFSQANNFHTSMMEDTDHKVAWQRDTFP